MSLLLDHLFIITEPGAEAARRFVELGLVEGEANVHPGQGTSNRRFFLDGFTIELLYVRDADEAANGPGRRLGLLERSLDSGASPFGLVARVNAPGAKPDFPGWHYFPDYFHGKLSFRVGENSGRREEPLCICMPPALSGSPAGGDEHDNPRWRLTRLDLRVPVPDPSPSLRRFVAMDRVFASFGSPHAVSMTFDDGAAGRSADLRPELPVTLSW